MVHVTAGDAPEDGLTPVLRGDVAARGTGLAGVPGIHPENHAAPPRGLVVQHPEKGAPPLIEDRAVEPGLLPDPPTGSLAGPGGGGRHAPHVQVFHDDDRVVLADRCRDLMKDVGAAVGDLPVEPGELFPGLGPVLRSLLLAGEGPLEAFEPGRVPGEDAGGLDDRPVRERGEPGHSEVDTHDPRRGVNGRVDLPLRLDRDEPLLARYSDGDVLDRSKDRPALEKYENVRFHPVMMSTPLYIPRSSYVK